MYSPTITSNEHILFDKQSSKIIQLEICLKELDYIHNVSVDTPVSRFGSKQDGEGEKILLHKTMKYEMMNFMMVKILNLWVSPQFNFPCEEKPYYERSPQPLLMAGEYIKTR